MMSTLCRQRRIPVLSRFTVLSFLCILALALLMGFVFSSLLTRAVWEWGRIIIWIISVSGGLAIYLVLLPLVRQVYRREVQEETLRAHAGRLEQEVAARTRELQSLLREARTGRGRLEALLEVSRQLSLVQPSHWLVGTITKACAHLLDADSVGISLVEGDELVLMGTWGRAMPTLRLKIGESLSGIVAATGEPLLVTDPANDPRLIPPHRDIYRELGIQAFLGVPVKIEGRVVGVLSIRTKREQGFSEWDLPIARAFASQAAVALENARLYQETRHAHEELSRTRDQLTQAQKMEAVGRLAGGVAHDFNNILTVIMTRSELMLRGLRPEDDRPRQHLTLIQEAADRAAALTRQLLAFSRKQVLQPKVLAPNELVAGMAKMLRDLIGEDIELRTVLGPGLGQVKADPGQLEQVILNLAVNARDAMPHGGRFLIETANAELDKAFARHHPGAHPGRYVMLAVNDTGVGMDAETRAHIFEPFFTTKGPGSGTGLGLATVYGVVKQSGGYIWVDSEPGQGTMFKIYLPRVEDAAELVEPSPAPPELPRGSETILLVEDDEAVRHLAREILQMHGYTVLEARHRGEALRMAGDHAGPIHLMVTDVVMPGMSGRALAGLLGPLRPDMKVLYMSGYTDDAIVHHGVLDPGTAFLQKPFAADALARKVREVLDAPASRDSHTGVGAVPK